jgi:hypothetical protein
MSSLDIKLVRQFRPLPKIAPARLPQRRHCLGRSFKLLNLVQRRDLLAMAQCLRQLKFINQTAADRHFAPSNHGGCRNAHRRNKPRGNYFSAS